jgi:hypothetical protein
MQVMPGMLKMLAISLIALPALASCRFISVADVMAAPTAFRHKQVEIRAHLIGTRHGAYVADESDSPIGMNVSFATVGPHSDTARALVERLRNASIGKPFADLDSVFKGRISIDESTGRPQFEIHAEVYGTGGHAED